MFSHSPVFVVGMPRSGTTLVSAMLSAHPNIAISPETHFLRQWLRDYGHLDVRRPEAFDRFWHDFSRSKHFRDLQLDPEVTRRQILALPRHDFRHIFMTLLQSYANSLGKMRWGEKTPMHERHLDLLLDWFPQAKIVYLLRDPRAVIASLLKVPWATRTVEQYAVRWHASVQNIGRRSTDARVQVVKYENLVQSPELELLQLCSFLEEAYLPSMLAYGEAAKSLVSGETWKAAALQSVTTSSIDKWQTQLSPQQVASIEDIAGPQMPAHGYEPVTAGLNRLQRSGRHLTKAGSALHRLTFKSSRRWAKRLLKPPASEIG